MKKVGFSRDSDSAFKSKYKVTKTLGKGAFSYVKIATQRETHDRFAVKIINVGEDSAARIEDVHREVEILGTLDHRSIMRYIESFEERQKVYIVSELLPGARPQCDTYGM
eukprot:scaffold44838_cov43-Prasinocladus_malaysianus.AAC.1